MNYTLGQKIKTVRKLAGFNQEKLGDIIGKSFKTISSYELDNNEPDLETLKSIAEACNVETSIFVDDEKFETRIIELNKRKYSFIATVKMQTEISLDLDGYIINHTGRDEYDTQEIMEVDIYEVVQGSEDKFVSTIINLEEDEEYVIGEIRKAIRSYERQLVSLLSQ